MNHRGFSMIELVMVTVISSLLLLAALPSVGKFRSTMRRSQARQQLLRDIRGARQRAVTGRTPVVVAFGNGSTTTNVTSYTIHRDANGDRVVQSGELKISRTLPTGTTLAKVAMSPTDSIIFDISGILWPSTSGGSLMINSNGVRETLDVSSTGMVYKR